MKTAFFFSLIALFLIYACNNTSNKEVLKTPNKLISTLNVAVDTSCFSSYQIYKETGYMWGESWVNYFNQYKGTKYKTSPEIFFDADNLNQLHAYVPNAEGVLIYYILLDTSAIYPSLAIVNTTSCTPNFGATNSASILVSNGVVGVQSFITRQEFNEYKTNWSNRGIAEANVFTTVDAYNYSWHSIRTLLDTTAINPGVFVKYGLRTIEPGDAADFSMIPDTTMTGSVVYCNILYGSGPQGVTGVSLYDFAKPCPIYCN